MKKKAGGIVNIDLTTNEVRRVSQTGMNSNFTTKSNAPDGIFDPKLK